MLEGKERTMLQRTTQTPLCCHGNLRARSSEAALRALPSRHHATSSHAPNLSSSESNPQSARHPTAIQLRPLVVFIGLKYR